jgi:large subunit ribosomal protein L33
MVPEDYQKEDTGTRYYVKKPTKGEKRSIKLKQRKYDPVLKKHVWFVEKKMPPHSK